jgi:sulfur-carrier protein
MASVRILYFAWLREAIGHDQEQIDLPADCATLHDVAAWLAGRSDGHARAFGDLAKVRAACDQTMTTLDSPVGDSREIAFFPPVTGG